MFAAWLQPVADDRLAVRIGRHPEARLLGQLSDGRIHAEDATLPA